MSELRDLIKSESKRLKCSMDDLTALSTELDPFRLDRPSRHRDGEWVAGLMQVIGHEIHCRGLHYAAIGRVKPDGERYANTADDWQWIQAASKCARWLGHIDFDSITDERNTAPLIMEFERPEPQPSISFGDIQLIPPAHLTPRASLQDFRAVQPNRLVVFGEKVSLRPVLEPLAEEFGADLYLPTGEASDTMCHRLADRGHEDGRRLIIFYFSDCDPSGWQMAVSVSRKLQGFAASLFPGLEFELHPVALTPDQVREHDLPSDPLKNSDPRAPAWLKAHGISGTEIDALATLQPELLEEIARAEIDPFYDHLLAARVRETRLEWERRAQRELEDAIGQPKLEEMRVQAQAKLDEIEQEAEELRDLLRVDVDGIELPEPPELPDAEIEQGHAPLISSDDAWAEQTLKLIAHKHYRELPRCEVCDSPLPPSRAKKTAVCRDPACGLEYRHQLSQVDDPFGGVFG